ncbi:MAG: hypothetical protein LQ342_007283 [Letrouitia transgressa]|nr:MAG: hypothetical protein LQ342_007283 [Letrouitia transgressa]
MTDNIGDTPSMALKRQIQDLKKELNDQGVLLNHLKTLPEKEAVELLRRLQTTSDPSRYRPSQQVAARGILPPVQTDSEFELTVRHPMAYPALVPVNTASISLSPSSTPTVRRRITSSNEPTNSASLGLISSRKSVEKPPLAPLRADARSTSSVLGPLQARSYLDERLHGLSIGYWTRVPISDELAADIISFYLEVDHPSLGFFDADLFLGDLVGHQLRFCSAFLVSSLLFYACQSYTPIDIRASALSHAFFIEAEIQWPAERSNDSIITAAAVQIFSYGCVCQGRDELSLELCREGRDMAERLGLFGGSNSESTRVSSAMSSEWKKATAHVAWGIHNWLTDDPDWRFYFALSIRIYQDLYVCFPIYKHIVQGFLAMAMENDAITVSEARNIIEQFEEKGKHHKTSERVVGSFTIDFDLALTKPDDAKAHTLALKFHELSIFDQFTSGEFVNQEVEATREMEEKITTVS